MVINRIRIQRFGALCDREISVMSGLNIIEGENESGKTTVAVFLRYIFYGIGNDSASSHFLKLYPTGLPEDPIGGSLDITLTAPLAQIPDVLDYRISRYCLPDGAETCTVCPLYGEEVGEPVCEDTDPGELFFGVGGDVFSASVFVGQINATVHAGKGNGGDGGNYTGGSPVRAAIDRILYAANEELDPDAAVCALTEKRNALFDPETETGSIVELERRRAAMASTLEAAENAPAQTDAVFDEENADATPAEDAAAVSAEELQQLQQALQACNTAVAEKEARASRLQKLWEQYEAYRALDDLDSLKTMKQQQSAAEVRAASLAAAMFRGNYIPDRDYVDSLRLCADDMRQAAEQTAAARAELDRLDFSVRRDNIKEKQLRRMELDGGADAIRARLDKLYGKRSVVTVFGVLFMLFTVFALASTAFLMILHSDLSQMGMIATAVLGALAFFFFLSRARYERSISVMFSRYNCTTEDELENFIEEYVLSRGKFRSLTENKETLQAQISEQSLHGSEAARQAALLLSKLQPPEAQKITADRLTPDVVSSAADRIDRTLAELDRLYQTADTYRDAANDYLRAHHAQNEEMLAARRQSLAAVFERDGVTFRAEPLQQELQTLQNALAELYGKQAALQSTLAQYPATQAAMATEPTAAAPTRNFRRAATCDIGPDPRILRKLIAEMDDKLRRDRKQYAALNLAIDAVSRASIALHHSIAPRLTENAGKLMALLSDQRYSALMLDDDMHLRAAQNAGEDGTKVLPIDVLSAGTQDLAYLSLRMALLHMLYPKELPPLLFDEAFATLDDKRLTRIIALLHRASAPASDAVTNTSQAIVFTCHKRESRAAQALADCHILKL